jgi:hypothetical protein
MKLLLQRTYNCRRGTDTTYFDIHKSWNTVRLPTLKELRTPLTYCMFVIAICPVSVPHNPKSNTLKAKLARLPTGTTRLLLQGGVYILTKSS